MDWRSSWLKERKTLVHALAAVLLSLAVLVSGEGLAVPAGNVTTLFFYYPFQKLKDALDAMKHTAEDNAALSATVVDLSTRVQFYNEILTENERLRAMLGFIERSQVTVLPAEIVNVEGPGIPNRVLINLGAADRIQRNQPVVNRDGLAGRVASVMSNYSLVYLMTDPRCRVAARDKRSREQGIIRYRLYRGMYLDNCPQHADVAVGDTIITSGLGGIFPEGLVIGIVTGVESPENDYFYNITIEPAVNFNGLDELYILVGKP